MAEQQEFFATAQTHTAVLVMLGDRVFKLKKPVDLGFLNFTRREDREATCHREVTLNRRIAPDVYLGVADVIGPDGAVCDHLVVMRRMPGERRLSTLVSAGSEVDGPVREVARQLASLHSRTALGPEARVEGSRDAIRRRWTDNLTQVGRFRGNVLPDGLVAEIERLTDDFLAGREPLFDRRMAQGRIVDGHGDLLADDVFCLDDGPRILDCIEFDDRLRWVDGLDDAAFLAMDLEYLGASSLATRFLGWYAEFAADPVPLTLRHHFIAYRAFVRAKVACLRHEQGDEFAADIAARHAELTAGHLRTGVVAVVLVGGLPGTGKSTLSGALADRLGASILSSDRVRKELAGRAGAAVGAMPYRTGIYSPEWTERTYRELLTRAETLLSMGESVILDASWTKAAHRDLARTVASRTHSRLVELLCEAPADVTVTRLRERTGSDSDADDRVAAAMTTDAQPWPEASTVRTDDAPGRSVERALRIVR